MKITITIACDGADEARHILKKIGEVEEFEIKGTPFKIKTAAESEPALPTSDQAERPNTDPGLSAICKIGSGTQQLLLDDLRAGRQPADKYTEHMKLLWQRKLIKFSGVEYYL